MFEGLDIDWFAFSNLDTVLHFASGGGTVPSFVNEGILVIRQSILSLPVISPEIIVNDKLENFVSIPDENSYKSYIESFCEYAKRGLFSYDKSILNDYSNTLYHLVASPTKLLNKELLPRELALLMASQSLSIKSASQVQIDIGLV